MRWQNTQDHFIKSVRRLCVNCFQSTAFLLKSMVGFAPWGWSDQRKLRTPNFKGSTSRSISIVMLKQRQFALALARNTNDHAKTATVQWVKAFSMNLLSSSSWTEMLGAVLKNITAPP